MLPGQVSHIVCHGRHPLRFKTAFHTLPNPGRVHNPGPVFFLCGAEPGWKSPWLMAAPAHTCPWAVQWDQRHEILPNSNDIISESQAEWLPPRFKLELKFSNSICDTEHFVQMELTSMSMCKTEQCGLFWLKGWYFLVLPFGSPTYTLRISKTISMEFLDQRWTIPNTRRRWGNWPTRNERGVGRPAQRS